MKNIVILISGRGSNMQAIINANIVNARIAAVLSNNPHASGLIWADKHGIATAALNHRDYPDRLSFDQAMIQLIDNFHADVVVLAGFMRILTAEFCQHYQQRLINIHPSLLPSFTGLNTHQRALDAGCRIAGCTVHFVTAQLDCGPIIAQGVVPILDNDNATTLSSRVLALEHRILPQAISDFINGYLHIDGNRVIRNNHTIQGTEQFIA